MADDSKFGIEVEVDTKGATKKLDDLNKKAEETNKTLNEKKELRLEAAAAILGLENIDAELQQINKSLDSVEQKSSAAFNVGKLVLWYEALKKIGQVALSVANYVLDAAKEMTSLSNTAQGLSISTNTLKAWETTFKAMGFDAREADAALSSIQDKLTGQLLNPSIQVASAFAMMGVNLRKANGELRDADDVLGEVAKKFKLFKPEYAIAIGSQIGLNRNQVIQMRNNPNFAKTLAEQRANPVVTTPEEEASRAVVEQNAKLTAEMEKVKNDGLMPLNNTLKNDILPPLTKIADALSLITGSAVTGALHTIGTTFSKGPAALLKEGERRFPSFMHSASQGIGNFAQSISQKASATELTATARIMGMTDEQIKTMLHIAAVESKLKNVHSDVPGSTASGYFQFTKDTLAGLAKNNPGFNPNDMSIANQVKAYSLLHKEFEGVAKQSGVNPNDEQQYRAFHNLGQPNYKKALEMQKNNPNLTYGNVYQATDPSGKTAAGNAGLVNQRFPALSMGQNVAPTASDSTSVTNNIVHNNQSSSINSSTHIGAVNVSANNPEQFANQLSNYKYLDRINNMTGRLT
jgi:hypothetical protein